MADTTAVGRDFFNAQVPFATQTDSAGRVYEASIASCATLTPNDSATVTAGRQFAVNCTTPGTVTVGFPDGSTFVFNANLGLTLLPWQVTKLFATGTSALGNFANLI